MRPAQKAPENLKDGTNMVLGFQASMRPAQKAPENGSFLDGIRSDVPGFNEAGAKSAGKLPDVHYTRQPENLLQ